MNISQTGMFCDLLKRYRQAAGITQEELAERADLSLQAVNTLECGRRTAPRPETVRALARALDLNPVQAGQLAAAVDRRRGPNGAWRPRQAHTH